MFKKAFKRIGKDRVKLMVAFQALNLTITCQQSISLRLQIKRGDQRPENLELLHISGKPGQQSVTFPSNQTVFECSYFIKDGVPDAKMANIAFFAIGSNGGEAIQISTLDVNFSMHFGAQFEETTMQLKPTQQAMAQNMIVHSIRYKAKITPKKDKDSTALTQCISWREQTHQEETKKQAAFEERKRQQEQKRQQDQEARRRQSEMMKQNEPIRGLGGFQQAFQSSQDANTSNKQQRTSSQMPSMGLQSSSLIQSAAEGSQNAKRLEQRTQSQHAAATRNAESQRIVSDLAQAEMIDDINKLDKQEQRKSLNRSAVKTDLRASTELNREAVKTDLRSGAGSMALEPTLEEKSEGSSNSDQEDPFATVLIKAGNAGQQEESKAIASKKNRAGGDDQTESEDDEAVGGDVAMAAQHKAMAAMKARQNKEEREKDLEIERLKSEIQSHEEGQSMLQRKQQLEQEISALQAAIEKSKRETDEAIAKHQPEKDQLLQQVAELTEQVDQQEASQSQLEKQLEEPRIKLENAEREFTKATKEDQEVQAEYEHLEKTLVERRQFLETESAAVQREIAQVAELENFNAEISQTVEENAMAIESKTGQIDATCKFLDDMEGESEKISENINECDEQLQVQGNQEIIQATSEASRLRYERNDLEKQKYEMQEEAKSLRALGIELQQKITSGQKRNQNIEAYTSELEVVIEDSKTEASKYKVVIQEQKIQKAKELEAAKEREKIKRKMTARKKREKQKSQQLEIQEAEQQQRTISQARLDQEMIRAANEITEQFNEENESRIIDVSGLVIENIDENIDEAVSVKSQEKIFDELQTSQQMTAEERAEMFHNNDVVNQSRINQSGVDISFFSDAGGRNYQQSFRSEREDEDADGGTFNFDALMKEKVARDTFKGSESQRESFMNGGRGENNTTIAEQQNAYQTPHKDVTQHFETGKLQSNTTVKQGAAGGPTDSTVTFQYASSSNDKSLTEPDQLSLSRNQNKISADGDAVDGGETMDAAWLNYQEKKSAHQQDMIIDGHGQNSGNMLSQIAAIENRVNDPRPSIIGEAVLLEQIAALEANMKNEKDSGSDDNSDYDSFHSDEVEKTPDVVENIDSGIKSLPPKKKDWNSGLMSIREDRSDSIISLKESDLAKIYAASGTAMQVQQEGYGAVGPQKKETASIAGSVQVVVKEESSDSAAMILTKGLQDEERPRSSSHEIRQKILLATTPKSKERVVEELTFELNLIKTDIKELEHLGEGSNSPERSLSVNSNTAVPIINPSTQDKLAEKYRIKDQIESGLKQLEDRERRQNMLSMAATTSSLIVEERDPYAPTDSSSFINSSLRQSMAHSRTSSFSSNSSQNRRSGSRGSLYRSTNYDRQEQRSKKEKSRRQIFTEMAMRDMQFMLASGKHVFSALSDYELMEGFNQFEAMLRMDKSCHEAMFGLGKLNFMIKRYELAERWFADAFAKKRDYVYRAWLGFTYVQLYKAVSETNPKASKYLSYAVKNLTRCVKEDDLAPFTIMALLCLSVDLQKAAKPGIKGLEEPEKYLSGLKTCLRGKGPLELGLAQAYMDLNTGGRISQGVQTLQKLIQQHQSHPESYLMLSRHYSLRKEYSDEKRILAQAISKCTEFQSYPERLILTLAHAKCLTKDRQINSHLEAVNLLQLQYTRTPHYASSLLFAYGKAIIDCQIVQLLPNAISALEEAQRCSVSLRVHNCFAYIAKAFDLMQRFPIYVSMHATNYRLGAQQLTYRVGETKQGSKMQKMINQLQGSSDPLMFDIISAVQSLAVGMSQSDNTQQMQGSPRFSRALSISDKSRSSFQLRSQTMVGGHPPLSPSQGAANRLNMFSSPLAQLPVTQQSDQNDNLQSNQLLLPLETQDNQHLDQEFQKLMQMTSRLEGSMDQRDKFVCQGLIIRGLKNDNTEAHNSLLNELIRNKETINENQDIQLQTLLIRSLRKANQTTRRPMLDPVQEGFNLMNMVRDSFTLRPSQMTTRPPVTTVCLIEAHIEAAKLFFSLSRSSQSQSSSSSLSSGTLLQLALNILLMTLPVLPQIDYKLGNPQLPVQVEEYGIADLESIDFNNCTSLQELATRIEETKQDGDDEQNSFSQSALMKHKILSGHFMIQGSIPIDSQQAKLLQQHNQRQQYQQDLQDDDKCVMFSFPESLADENLSSEIDSLATWSSTSLTAVVSFLDNNSTSSRNSNSATMAQTLNRLSKFHVHSSPDVLKHLGRFCIKSGQYADLAIFALREYLIAMTHSKMFSLAAGQGIADEATVQSGYTIIRDRTMLELAQALGQLSQNQQSQTDTQTFKVMVKDAQMLLTKVQKGANTGNLQQEINKTQAMLKKLATKR